MTQLNVYRWAVLASLLCACSSQKRLEPPGPAEQCETSIRSSAAAILPPTQQGASQALQLNSGESLCLEARPGTRWIQFGKLAKKGDARNLSIRLLRGGDGTTLSVKNPFDQAMTFDALVTLEGGESYPSSTCPARAHEGHVEHWEESLERVVLSNFTVRGAGAPDASCN